MMSFYEKGTFAFGADQYILNQGDAPTISVIAYEPNNVGIYSHTVFGSQQRKMSSVKNTNRAHPGQWQLRPVDDHVTVDHDIWSITLFGRSAKKSCLFEPINLNVDIKGRAL